MANPNLVYDINENGIYDTRLKEIRDCLKVTDSQGVVHTLPELLLAIINTLTLQIPQ